MLDDEEEGVAVTADAPTKTQHGGEDKYPEKNGTQNSKHLKFATTDNNDGVDPVAIGRDSGSNSNDGNGVDDHNHQNTIMNTCRTLDGELATDEYAQDAQNYRILLAKIDGLLDKLKLDA